MPEGHPRPRHDGYDYTTDPNNPLIALTGTIHGDILFFTCSQFTLGKSFRSDTPNTIQPLLRQFFASLKDQTGIKGILLDVRGNLGGDIGDLNFLAGQFTDKPLHFGSTKYKGGNSPLDYTPWIDAIVQSAPGAIAAKVPVVILADAYTASAAELFAMAMHTLPGCRIVGETTFGATGPLTGNTVYNDGSFDVPGFLSVETSSAEFKYIDGKIYEGKGFPPDYPVPFDPIAIGAGKDPQMSKAISLFQ